MAATATHAENYAPSATTTPIHIRRSPTVAVAAIAVLRHHRGVHTDARLEMCLTSSPLYLAVGFNQALTTTIPAPPATRHAGITGTSARCSRAVAVTTVTAGTTGVTRGHESVFEGGKVCKGSAAASVFRRDLVGVCDVEQSCFEVCWSRDDGDLWGYSGQQCKLDQL